MVWFSHSKKNASVWSMTCATFVSPKDRSEQLNIYWHSTCSKFIRPLSFSERTTWTSRNDWEKSSYSNWLWQFTSFADLFQWTWAWHELRWTASIHAHCAHAIRSWINMKFIIITCTTILIERVFSLSFFYTHKSPPFFALPIWLLRETAESKEMERKSKKIH